MTRRQEALTTKEGLIWRTSKGQDICIYQNLLLYPHLTKTVDAFPGSEMINKINKVRAGTHQTDDLRVSVLHRLPAFKRDFVYLLHRYVFRCYCSILLWRITPTHTGGEHPQVLVGSLLCSRASSDSSGWCLHDLKVDCWELMEVWPFCHLVMLYGVSDNTGMSQPNWDKV